MPESNYLSHQMTWIIPLLPEKLPGKVVKRVKNKMVFVFIEPLIKGLPLSDGTIVQKFFAPEADALEEDYVIFKWETLGKRGYNHRKDQYGDPIAVEVEIISEDNAKQIAFDIREKIGENLKNNIQEQYKKSQEAINRNLQDIEKAFSILFIENSKYVDDIHSKIKEVQEQYEKIKNVEAELDNSKQLLEQRLQGLEPYGILLETSEENQQNDNREKIDLSKDFGKDWTEKLRRNGLYVTKEIANSYLISIFSALYLGRLVLLNGTVGVGKTSIVKHSANILGGQSNIIPVRPAWLDPSDLLGFYDPLQEIFRPAPFLSALNEARKDNDRLHLVCLDELNLAKIENYASDLLSKLEYSRQSNDERLILFSRDIWEHLSEECIFLFDKKDELNFKEQQRLKRLQKLFTSYSDYRFQLPKNLVLLGTLNSDETTYDLSPKLIDRSFIITYPAAELPQHLPSSFKLNPKTNEIQNLLSYSIAEKVENLQVTLNFNTIQEYWNLINRWNNNYLKKGLGIPLGYRIFEDYKIFLSVGTYLGFSHEESFGYFIFAKILPRIKFLKDEENRKVKLLQTWIGELKRYQDYDPANILEKLCFQINQEQEQYISYWNFSTLENLDSSNEVNSSNLPADEPSPSINDFTDSKLEELSF